MDCFFFGFECGDCEYWFEDFFVEDCVVGYDVGEDGGFVECVGFFDCFVVCEQCGVVFDGVVDEFVGFGYGVFVDEWFDCYVFFCVVVDFYVVDMFGYVFGEFVCDVFVYDEVVCCGVGLVDVVEFCGQCVFYGFVEVGIVEYYEWGVVVEFY